jgi:hypothetical protein
MNLLANPTSTLVWKQWDFEGKYPLISATKWE